MEIQAAPKPAIVLLSLTSVYVLLELAIWLLPLTPIPGWQQELYWNYASHVVFITLALGAMLVLRRPASLYGLRRSTIRRELALGGANAAWLFLVPLVAEATLGDLKLNRTGLGFVISTVVFQLFFAGFGEELLYRGFFQGELNRVFARSFRFGRTRFGWGLILTSLLFGVGHLLNDFNPLLGQYSLNWGEFFGTVLMAVAFGLIREHFGSILAPSLIHGGANLFITLFNLSPTSGAAWIVASFSAGAMWIHLMLSGPEPSGEPPPGPPG